MGETRKNLRSVFLRVNWKHFAPGRNHVHIKWFCQETYPIPQKLAFFFSQRSFAPKIKNDFNNPEMLFKKWSRLLIDSVWICVCVCVENLSLSRMGWKFVPILKHCSTFFQIKSQERPDWTTTVHNFCFGIAAPFWVIPAQQQCKAIPGISTLITNTRLVHPSTLHTTREFISAWNNLQMEIASDIKLMRSGKKVAKLKVWSFIFGTPGKDQSNCTMNCMQKEFGYFTLWVQHTGVLLHRWGLYVYTDLMYLIKKALDRGSGSQPCLNGAFPVQRILGDHVIRQRLIPYFRCFFWTLTALWVHKLFGLALCGNFIRNEQTKQKICLFPSLMLHSSSVLEMVFCPPHFYIGKASLQILKKSAPSLSFSFSDSRWMKQTCSASLFLSILNLQAFKSRFSQTTLWENVLNIQFLVKKLQHQAMVPSFPPWWQIVTSSRA